MALKADGKGPSGLMRDERPGWAPTKAPSPSPVSDDAASSLLHGEKKVALEAAATATRGLRHRDAKAVKAAALAAAAQQKAASALGAAEFLAGDDARDIEDAASGGAASKLMSARSKASQAAKRNFRKFKQGRIPSGLAPAELAGASGYGMKGETNRRSAGALRPPGSFGSSPQRAGGAPIARSKRVKKARMRAGVRRKSAAAVGQRSFSASAAAAAPRPAGSASLGRRAARATRQALRLGSAGALAAAAGGLTLAMVVIVAALAVVSGGLAASTQKGNPSLYMAQAEEYAKDDSIGYSMERRYHNPDMDCSSYVYYCLVDSGYCTADELGCDSPFTTMTMGAALEKSGKFRKLDWDGSMDSLERGDILVDADAHTEFYAGNGQNYGAHGDFDGLPHDGNGDEVCIGPYYNNSGGVAWDSVYRPISGGGDVQIPSAFGSGGYTVTFYTRLGVFANGKDQAWGTPSTREVHDKWVSAGAEYDEGIAKFDGRYLIACTTTFGTVGDKVDFVLENGTVIPCIVADTKNMSDSGCNKWGHNNGKNIIEFEVSKDYFYQAGCNPGSGSWHPELGGSRVSSASNKGSILG